MNITILGKEVKATDAIKEYINKKVSRLEKHFTDGTANITVTIKNEKNMQVAEMQILHNSESYRAEAKESDLYASIDKDLDIIEGQLRKNKAKKEKITRDDSIRFKSDIASSKSSTGIENEIVKVTAYDIKPMTAEDAKLKLQENPKDIFLTYIDVNTGKANVIYKLKDGKNYGVVEPEA